MMDEEQANLLDYWRTLMKWKVRIVAIVFVLTLLAIVATLVWPVSFRGEVVLMPVGGAKDGAASILTSQLGLGGLLGAMGKGATSSNQLMAVLKSRSLAEEVIKKFDLMKVFFKHPGLRRKPPTMEDAVDEFASYVKFTEDKKTQLIRIRAVFREPVLSADVANGIVAQLQKDLQKYTLTTAKRNRIFLEGQLERNKAELLEAGKSISSFYGENKVSNVRPLFDVDVSMPDAKLQNSEPQSVPELQSTVEDLQKKADDLRDKIRESNMVRDVPQQVYLQFLMLRRELLSQVNALLTQQYEMAKSEEAKEDLTFQVIDWARVPVNRYKPKRTQSVIISFLASIFLAVFYAFSREYIDQLRIAESKKRIS
ncbi:MAG TPA: hypothetical protein VFX30_07795 [bacterium]|nr:hypothetical protein [bacterium]